MNIMQLVHAPAYATKEVQLLSSTKKIFLAEEQISIDEISDKLKCQHNDD